MCIKSKAFPAAISRLKSHDHFYGSVSVTQVESYDSKHHF